MEQLKAQRQLYRGSAGGGRYLQTAEDTAIQYAGRGVCNEKAGDLGSSLPAQCGDASVTVRATAGTRIRVSRPTAGKAAVGPAGRGFEGVGGDDTSAQAQATSLATEIWFFWHRCC